MLVTLHLISANVYNSVYAPPGRGFSYIELWMIGMQIPILVALIEYSLVLGFKRFMNKTNNAKIFINRRNVTNINLEDGFYEKIDMISLVLSLIYIVMFSLWYWFLLY